MLRLFDGEMKYTYFKIVHGQCLQVREKVPLLYMLVLFFCLGKL